MCCGFQESNEPSKSHSHGYNEKVSNRECGVNENEGNVIDPFKPKIMMMVMIKTAPTSQKTQPTTITNINSFTLFKEIVTVLL
jgi:hypothetical protein